MATIGKSTLTETRLAEMLWEAKTSADVQRIVSAIGGMYGVPSWRPVGDRPKNIGVIGMSSDPALALVERVTNGMDALLELGYHNNPGDEPKSPREAARMWYGIPQSGLADMSEAQRRDLGGRLQVILEESGEDKRPTVVIEDEGIGQTPRDFPRTLLSLNESNKVGLPWTMGTYGQGGSVTYRFSRATIIISRRHPDYSGGQPDKVGWTIVLEQETDPTSFILPSYEYLVDPDMQVFSLDPSLFPDLEYGTRIIHVGYDLQGWSGPFTTGIWQLFHATLFDPVLPFLITGNRKKEIRHGSRIVIGNAARLNRPDRTRGNVEITYANSHRVSFGDHYGDVTINYWVVQHQEGKESKSAPTESYVRADSAISLTLFGQRQDKERRAWIKDKALLPLLVKNLIVQIDSDFLTGLAKRELFASTRETATISDLRTEIYDVLGQILREDEELDRLNRLAKERLYRSSTSAASEKVRDRLRKFVHTRSKQAFRQGRGGAANGQQGRRVRPPGPRPRPTPPPPDDSKLPSVPTYIRFTKPSVRLWQGRRASVEVELNAKNGYLPDHNDSIEILWMDRSPSGKVRLRSTSKLLGGYSRWYFECDEDVVLGSYKAEIGLITPNGYISDALSFEIVSPPSGNSSRPTREPDTGPDVRWVDRDGWGDHDGMDANSVGYVVQDSEGTTIWINRNFLLLDRLLAGRNLSERQISTRQDRYQYPVACGLWLQNEALKTADEKPDDNYIIQERYRMAEAVLAAMEPDMDTLDEDD